MSFTSKIKEEIIHQDNKNLENYLLIAFIKYASRMQNDELTFNFAKGNDWWFHSKKIHGSHVIAKVKDNEELPDHIFEIAANVAAYYSSARESSKVEIDYIQKKHIKKPNTAVPGFVVYYTNYSIVATPSLEEVKLV